MAHTKIVKADLDSPRQEVSNSGLKFAVVLLVCSGIIFVCAYNWGAIQLYLRTCVCANWSSVFCTVVVQLD